MHSGVTQHELEVRTSMPARPTRTSHFEVHTLLSLVEATPEPCCPIVHDKGSNAGRRLSRRRSQEVNPGKHEALVRQSDAGERGAS